MIFDLKWSKRKGVSKSILWKGLCRHPEIYEYISVWLSALIISTILILILINTLLKGMISYYYVENRTIFINLIKVAAGVLAILTLTSFIGKRGKKVRK